MNLHEAISKQARGLDLKSQAAFMVARLMMAHYDGPFDDSMFYDEYEPAAAADYFDEHKKELYNDREFRRMVVRMVSKRLLDD